MKEYSELFVRAIQEGNTDKIKQVIDGITKDVEICIIKRDMTIAKEIYTIINSIKNELSIVDLNRYNLEQSPEFYIGFLYAYVNILGLMITKDKNENIEPEKRNDELLKIRNYLAEYGTLSEVELSKGLGMSTHDILMNVNGGFLEGNSDIIVTMQEHTVYYSTTTKGLAKSKLSKIRSNDEFKIGG